MSHELDRILALEDEARLLRRELGAEQNERHLLTGRLKLVEERLVQVESDVKDAHDRAQNVEDRIELIEDDVARIDPNGEEAKDEVDERELGEAGA